MKLRVKTFATSDDLAGLEDQINSWLEAKEGIAFHSLHFAQSTGAVPYKMRTVLILYEDVDAKARG